LKAKEEEYEWKAIGKQSKTQNEAQINRFV
jgi:hypothetical protein